MWERKKGIGEGEGGVIGIRSSRGERGGGEEREEGK